MVTYAVKAMRVKDGMAVQRDRALLADEFADDAYMLNSVYMYPLLKHGLEWVEVDGQRIELTLEAYMELPEAHVMGMIDAIIERNPQHDPHASMAYLKNLLGGLLTKSDDTNAS